MVISSGKFPVTLVWNSIIVVATVETFRISEFTLRNKIKDVANDLIIINNGKYLIHIDYIYVEGHDISKVSCKIIERYVELLMAKDHAPYQYFRRT